MSKQGILFLHIPKTAGTSISRSISKMLSNSYYGGDINQNFVEEVKCRLENGESSYDFIYGHLADYKSNISSILKYYDFITVIRNPLDHIRSHYKHIVRSEESLLHDHAKTLSIKEFFSIYREYFSNFQYKYIMRSFGLGKEFSGNSLDFAESSRLAKDIIDKFSLICTTDRLPEMLTSISFIYGFDSLISTKNENVSPIHQNLSASDEMVIADFCLSNCSMDMMLYNYANETFEKKVDVFLRERNNRKFLRNNMTNILKFDQINMELKLDRNFTADRDYHKKDFTYWWVGPRWNSYVYIENRNVISERQNVNLRFVIREWIGIEKCDVNFYLNDAMCQVRWSLTNEKNVYIVDVSIGKSHFSEEGFAVFSIKAPTISLSQYGLSYENLERSMMVGEFCLENSNN